MKYRYVTLFFLLTVVVVQAQTPFNEAVFFQAIASEDIKLVDKELSKISHSSIKEKEAYEGTLLMKKAGLISKPRTKLSSFKAGHGKLESAISKDPANAIYRFLRLIIQENAPRILNYNDQIEEDSKHVREAFANFSPMLQNAILDYVKKSKTLRIASTAETVKQ